MASDRQSDDTISSWLEESAVPRIPDRVLEATFERTRRTKQHVGWRARVGRLLMAPAVPAFGGAAVVVLAVVLGVGLSLGQPRVGGPAVAVDPRIPFLDTWLSTDPDGSTLAMTIRTSGEAALEITVLDDFASVCSGASSTMTGTGRLEGPGTFVIPSPAYTCDDGSVPEALSGPPLDEQLRNLTFVLDQQTETMTDSLDAVWVRKGAEPPRPPTAWTAVWPQTSLEAVRQAQARADAGDPAFTWQVDPGLAGWQDDAGGEILARFLRDQLGWEAFRRLRTSEWGEDSGVLHGHVVRCAPELANPLYPDDPVGGGCAPTIDDLRYEQVGVDLRQPIRQDPTGIWVVTGWEALEPFEQARPAEVTGVVEAFLRARIAGQDAEPFVSVDEMAAPSREVPLLYATSSGSPYERGEFDVVDGPTWPSGWMRLRVRLFADGGATVVEQQFDLDSSVEAGQPILHYLYPWDRAPTTENGTPVAVQYGFIPDEVTFRAAWPWQREIGDQQSPRLVTLFSAHEVPDLYHARLAVVADPRPIERGCEEGPAPADAAALARSIQADPDLDATAPVAVTIGGLPALRMDVDQAPGASLCDNSGPAMAVTAGIVGESNRMRLWLLDLPGGSVRTLAIALTASTSDFERVMEAEAPLLDSFEFDTP